MEDKKSFVEDFGKLLHKYGIEYISRIEYEKNSFGEFVNIFYTHGNCDKVNINMDSLPAIIRDIMNIYR